MSGAELHGLVPDANAVDVLDGLSKTQGASTNGSDMVCVWIRGTSSEDLPSPIPE